LANIFIKLTRRGGYVSRLSLNAPSEKAVWSPRELLDVCLLEKLKNVPLSDTTAAHPLRLLFSSAQELEEDNQGRTMLPKNLREFAKLNKDIVFIGVGNRAEIWSREAYDKQFAEADFDKALSGLKEYGV
jgi:MraZ protein